jgi:hypothetical protein
LEARNLGRILGWHESYLNSPSEAFEKGLIDDWIR